MDVKILRKGIDSIINPEDLPLFAWEDFLGTMYPEYGWFVSNTMLLPFYMTKRAGIRRLFFTTGIIYRANVSLDEEREFLNETIKLARTMNVDCIDEPYSNALFNVVPDKVVYAEYGSYVVELNKTDDELLAGIHSKFRSPLKKAISEGLAVKSGVEYLAAAADLIKETYTRQDKEHESRKELEDLSKKLGEHFMFYAVFNGAELEGVAVIPWTKHSAVYLHGGSAAHVHPGALKLLHYRIMCDMRDKGVKLYDYMGARINPEPGSKYEGLQMFKSRMGSTLKTGYRWFYIINPFKYYLFKLLLQLKSLTKGKIYKDAGILYERKRQRAAQKGSGNVNPSTKE